MSKKVAVILMNLGGPDCLAHVRPFLVNLFSDPAILDLPKPLRRILVPLIARCRDRKSQRIYQQIGGKSPLLENTKAQRHALEEALKHTLPDWESKVFIAMRYWHPLSAETVQDVRLWGPDRVIALPLYPQFSTTTTASSLEIWHRLAPDLSTLDVPSFYQEPGFIKAYQDLIQQRLGGYTISPRLLFSAHGLPQKRVDRGDPYQEHVEKTVAAIMKKFDLDFRICYQSKVGPFKWLQPTLMQELKQASRDRVGVIVVPISFVSENSETLVDLDRTVRQFNLPSYDRVPTVGTHPDFIAGLARLVNCTIEKEF
jgi:protoporphyrin/coproporphyrin ferrochelatase